MNRMNIWLQPKMVPYNGYSRKKDKEIGDLLVKALQTYG